MLKQSQFQSGLIGCASKNEQKRSFNVAVFVKKRTKVQCFTGFCK